MIPPQSHLIHRWLQWADLEGEGDSHAALVLRSPRQPGWWLTKEATIGLSTGQVGCSTALNLLCQQLFTADGTLWLMRFQLSGTSESSLLLSSVSLPLLSGHRCFNLRKKVQHLTMVTMTEIVCDVVYYLTLCSTWIHK